MLTTIGGIELAKEGNSSATDEDKYAAGQDVLTKWIADHDVEVNPKYGLEVGTATQVDTDLSYALGRPRRPGWAGTRRPSDPGRLRGRTA